MYQSPQGVPGLPDLTHPNELIEFGSKLISVSQQFALLVAVLGIALALLSFSLRRTKLEQNHWLGQWIDRYDLLLQKLPHGLLVLTLVIGGFFLSSTLANRYHHWEQARVAKVAASVAGDRLEQTAPQVRYVIQEPYTYDTQVEGKIVRVQKTRDINRFLTLAGSQIDVKIDQIKDVQDSRAVYRVNLQADYKVVNPLKEAEDFFFEVSPPNGYSLLQNFKVDQDGTRLVPVNPGDYGFPFRLEAGQQSSFRVTYQAQGGPRWVYDARGQLLSNFRLTALANFPNADFASGIVPTQKKEEGGGTRFTWVFDDNVSVRNPFGLFTSTGPIRNTGILPRLLLLAPALFLWWILMLYLSLPLNLRDVAIAGAIFFACLLSLTYLSRIVDVQLAWAMLSPVMLILVWGLGSNLRASLAAVIATIAGGIVPVLGLIVPYSGLTLSLAGLLCVVWLAVRHWYGWYRIEQDTKR
ncbi:hypothetical protein [Microcoleus sp. FACHB-672]|uniref:hypothetical protein n=1 Tax=Microcoleus sp. FACHB-672 TaxID=2692825 RepID=UPI001683D4E3|nr:hypothetical protein [Microcoleus sp. FACHB-672]MBD2041338.1 hypothetical protein [Microcoleus sp. FACHB-672]